jgi:hypothetical protein
MRFVALLVGMAIVCMLVLKRAQPSQVAEAMREADAVVEPVNTASAGSSSTAKPAATQSTPSTTGMRAPLDRTRSVLNQVKQRNGGGEF